MERLEELQRLIKQYDEAYYVHNKPLVPDVVYDKLYHELKMLERDLPESVALTKRVSGKAAGLFQKVAHGVPMLSIRTETYPSFENVLRWVKSCGIPGQRVFRFNVEYKYDGLGLNLVYNKGKIEYALTRGDGESGEDVQENAQYIQGFQFDLNRDVGEIPMFIELRGEVVLPTEAFENINRELAEAGLKRYVNPRNAASGLLRSKTPNIEHLKMLTFMPYGIGRVWDEHIDRGSDLWECQDDVLQWIVDALDIPSTPREFSVWSNTAESATRLILSFFNDIASIRDKIPYAIDGVVVKVLRLADQDTLGYVSREPRWAVALKFKAEEQITQLTGIDIQVGRTGVLTPVARLEPVFVGGTTVTNVTLHNVFDLRSRGVRVGDTVVVRRAGDVIPEITMPILEHRKSYLKNFHMPKTCPMCSGRVFREKGDRKYYCLNRMGCGAQIKASLEHFVSKNALAIDGIGSKLISQLVDLGIVRFAYDIYQLDAEKLSKVEGLGVKSISNILRSIEISRKTQTWRLIHGLGIPSIGESLSKLLAKHFYRIEPLMYASLDELKAIEGIGDIKAKNIHDFFKEPANSGQASALSLHCLKIVEIEASATGKLTGKVFVLTGTYPTLSRDELKQRIEDAGGKVASSVSKKTDYVVAGVGGGSKASDAEKLGIPIISEEEFLKML